jgi:hypothetical protein
VTYVQPSDFTKGSGKWYTHGLELTDDDADANAISDAIQAQSAAFDLYCEDHFEPEPGGSPEGTAVINVAGSGGPNLYVPKRIRSITDVSLRDVNGTLTSQDASVYRVTQSLVDGNRQEADLDMISVVSGKFLSGTGWWDDWTYPGIWTNWPLDIDSVQITGTFSWPVVPEQVKRAVALMVYDSIKPSAPGIRTASRYISGSTSFEMPPSTPDAPTGLNEVDRIIGQYTRNRIPAI